jgi:hypothetical protein
VNYREVEDDEDVGAARRAAVTAPVGEIPSTGGEAGKRR